MGLLASLSLHALALMLVASTTEAYDFDFEVVAPSELELGLSEAIPSAQGQAGLALRGSAESDPEPIREELAAKDRPKPEPNPTDAQTPGKDPSEERRKSDEEAQIDDEDVEPPPLPVARPTTEGNSRIPPGAQLALRLDLKRVRQSPLAPDVTRLVEGIPDWRMLLSGSGIDPVQDLDRLLVASPNLQRSKLVLAGRHRREPSFAKQRVEALAESRGKRVRWHTRFGVKTAAWNNLDSTSRTIALLGSHIFSITRDEDLERVLAMAKARELRDPTREGLVAARGADALLSMGPEEVLSVEVEGARRFVRGNSRHIPVRARLAVVETGPREATVHALAVYESAAEARAAADYWQSVADQYADQLWLSLAGFSSSLRSIELSQDDERIRIVFRLGHEQIRLVLSFLEGRLQDRSASRPNEKRGQGAPF